MKKSLKLVILIITIINLCTIYSQNRIDPPENTTINYPTLQNSKEFILGWNYGGPGAKLDAALNMNYFHGNIFETENNKNDHLKTEPYNPRVITSVDNLSGSRGFLRKINGQSLYLEPALNVASFCQIPDKFQPISEIDKAGAVFGFINRNTLVGTTNTGINGEHTFNLDKSNISNGNPQLVLSDIYPKDALKCYNFTWIKGEEERFDTVFEDLDYSGRRMYLSIGLKNLEQISMNDTDKTILTIKVKYKVKNQVKRDNKIVEELDENWHYANIYQVPLDGLSNVINSTNGTGFYRALPLTYKDKSPNSGSNPTTWVINGGAIRSDNNGTANNFITLSALYVFDTKSKIDSKYTNPFLTPAHPPYSNQDLFFNKQIVEIDVEVTYHGNLNVAIDWLRFETPAAQKLFRGDLDNEIKQDIEKYMEKFSSPDYDFNPKLFRIYTEDEILPCQYAAVRYLNALTGFKCISEGFIMGNGLENIPAIYYHATGFKEFWLGSTNTYRTVVPNPFIKKGKVDFDSHRKPNNLSFPNTFYYWYGWKGCNHYTENISDNEQIFTNFKDSRYETNLSCTYPTTPIVDRASFFQNNDIYNWGTLFNTEQILNNSYYDHPSIIFNKKDWWANIWMTSGQWIINTSNQLVEPVIDGIRPKTGEELRLTVSLPILLGAKGLLYWIKSTTDESGEGFYQLKTTQGGAEIGFQPKHYNYLNNYQYLGDRSTIYSNVLGGDYIVTSTANGEDHDPNFGTHFFGNDNLYNTLDWGVDFSHIYIGSRSQRAEAYKMHNFIKENESTLLNLKIESWYSKGFTEFWTDDRLNTSISKSECKINNYVDINSIRTRIIGKVKGQSNIFVPDYENLMSSFYDIAIHKENDANGNPKSNLFYIMVLNRRTDPLIIDDQIEDNLLFYTSADYDVGVQSNNYLGHTKSWWQNKWWKRLGTREIKFNLNLSSVDRNKLVKVTELSSVHKEFQTDYDSSYVLSASEINDLYPITDNIIGYDGTIIAKYLPGQLRIYKCEILDVDETLDGNLAHSNQSKLVVFPVIKPDGTLDPDKVQYHLVYFKQSIIEGISKTRVFYNKSNIIDKTSSSANIKWETTEIAQTLPVLTPPSLGYLVSWNMQNEYGQNMNQNINCNYPSLVVKKVNNQIRAYISYSCENYATNAYPGIYLAILDVTNDHVQPVNLYNRKISDYVLGNGGLNEWGNPVLNSSPNGQFLAWSTASASTQIPTSAIMVKHLDLSIPPILSGTKIIQPPAFDNWFVYLPEMKHPSFSYYTNYPIDETKLVWQCNFQDRPYDEYDPPGLANKSTKILYTRLKFENSLLVNYLPNIEGLKSFSVKSQTVPQPNIMMIDCNSYHDAEYPVIYNNQTNISEVISAVGPPVFYNQIFIYPLYGENYLNNLGTISFRNSYFDKYLYQPNLAQPPGLLFDGSLENEKGRYVINFKCGNSIYQYVGLFTPSFLNQNLTDKYSKFRNVENNADQPHLAVSYVSNIENIWKNKRVYNNSDQKIIGSSRYFLIYHDDDKNGENLLNLKIDSSFFYFNVPDYKQEVSFIKPMVPIITDNDTNYIVVKRDTIYSTWFQLDCDTVYLKVSAKDTCASLYLQFDDNYMINLSYQKTGNDKFAHHMKYKFINGDNNDFRFVVVKNDTNAYYSESIIIDGLPVLDTVDVDINLQRNKFNDISDRTNPQKLIKVNLSPIPASDELNIKLSLPSNVPIESTDNKIFRLKVFSLLGIKLFETEVQVGNSKISTKDLPSGFYYIQVSLKEEFEQYNISPVLKQFLIKR